MNQFGRLAKLTVISNLIYIIWLTLVQPPIYFYVLEWMIILLNLLFVINNYKRTYVLSGGSYSLRPIVDIFITTKNEDVALVEKTLVGANKILYPNKRIYVLDDGNRNQMKKIAEKHSATYMNRYNNKIYPFKAYNLNYGLRNSYGSFILVLDADMIPSSSILDNLLGFFRDEKVAFVSSRQGFNVDSSDFNHDSLFYEYAQTGKNTYGVGISCGSGVVYRRSALESIGGFQEWNIVEDLYTSYVLNIKGYRSVYVPQSFSFGDAPKNIAAIYKQRGTWAQDTLRIFFFKNPLFQKGLSFFQRTQYFEMGFVYIVSGLIFPIMYLISMKSLVLNDAVIGYGKEMYLIFRVPAFIISLLFFQELSHGENSMQMWASLFPVYFRSILKALIYRRPNYQVTPKGQKAERNIFLVLPQILFLACGLFTLVYHLFHYGLTWVFVVNGFWISVMIYFISPIIIRSLALKKI